MSYFCELRKEIIIEHLASVNIPIVNAETVYAAVVDLVKSKEIPWKNLLAMLMDSCGVMRVSKNGFETKIRLRVAPHLLDWILMEIHVIIFTMRQRSSPKSLMGIWSHYFRTSTMTSSGQRI